MTGGSNIKYQSSVQLADPWNDLMINPGDSAE
jgi:hypothetical protein